MMNGILMSAGIDAISFPAARAQEFNENIVRFYLKKDGTEMMAFLVECHPDAEQIFERRFLCDTMMFFKYSENKSSPFGELFCF